jgi:hypothetical protein
MAHGPCDIVVRAGVFLLALQPTDIGVDLLASYLDLWEPDAKA